MKAFILCDGIRGLAGGGGGRFTYCNVLNAEFKKPDEERARFVLFCLALKHLTTCGERKMHSFVKAKRCETRHTGPWACGCPGNLEWRGCPETEPGPLESEWVPAE